MRRSLAASLAALAATLVVVAGALAVPVAATPHQQPDAPADDGTGGSADDAPAGNPAPGAAEQDIIPRPDSGHEPTDAGDRGGALQIVLFAAIVAGVAGIALLAARDIRRARARAGGGPPAPRAGAAPPPAR